MMHPAFTCLLPFLPRCNGGGDGASLGGRVGGCLTSTRAITCVSSVHLGTELGERCV
jgi:hypothetical protein